MKRSRTAQPLLRELPGRNVRHLADWDIRDKAPRIMSNIANNPGQKLEWSPGVINRGCKAQIWLLKRNNNRNECRNTSTNLTQ